MGPGSAPVASPDRSGRLGAVAEDRRGFKKYGFPNEFKGFSKTSKWGEQGPRGTPEGTRRRPERPKRHNSEARGGPGGAQRDPRGALDGPRGAPKGPQGGVWEQLGTLRGAVGADGGSLVIPGGDLGAHFGATWRLSGGAQEEEGQIPRTLCQLVPFRGPLGVCGGGPLWRSLRDS